MLKNWMLVLLPIWFTFAILANQSEFYNQSNSHDLTYISSIDYLPNQTTSEIFDQTSKKMSLETYLLFCSKVLAPQTFSWGHNLSIDLVFYQYTHSKTKLNQFYLLV